MAERQGAIRRAGVPASAREGLVLAAELLAAVAAAGTINLKFRVFRAVCEIQKWR
jgi:hypothetical protein